MDLTKLSAHAAQRNADNAIITIERGQTVRRTYSQLTRDVDAVCERLSKWGLTAGMRVGIHAPNCYEWVVYDLALLQMRAVSVAFTDDFAEVPPAELIEQYQLSLFIRGPNARPETANQCAAVTYMGDAGAGVRVIAHGALAGDPDFVAPGLIFSSGSSGGVKGITLNRKGIETCVSTFTETVGPRRDDRFLLFLPISNFQQRLMYYSALWYGFDVIVIDPVRVFHALSSLKPTMLIAPPALFEAFESRLRNISGFKRVVFEIASRLVHLVPGGRLRNKVAGLVFKEAHEAFGGNMRLMITGMAPIKRTTLDLFQRLQLPLFETYGLIESGPVALNVPGHNRVGSVGRLLPDAGVEFAPDGEIIVRRKHLIALGYFECAGDENEKTFIGGGIATGDIGYIDADGYLYLSGRKKEIIVTPGGAKIHPEVIEAKITMCADVAAAVAIGRPGSPSVSVLVRPVEPENSAARARIQRHVDRLNDSGAGVPIGKLIFTDVTFSRENGFLRPNLKLDRRRIVHHFQAELEGCC